MSLCPSVQKSSHDQCHKCASFIFFFNLSIYLYKLPSIQTHQDFSWFISGVSMTPSVFQLNVSVTAPAGGSVILECYTTADLVVTWVWLKQIPGQKLNTIASTYYKEIKLQGEFVNESRFEVKVDVKKSALIFTKITSRDAAYYHCGVLLYETLYFGGGSYLTVNGEWKPGN